MIAGYRTKWPRQRSTVDKAVEPFCWELRVPVMDVTRCQVMLLRYSVNTSVIRTRAVVASIRKSWRVHYPYQLRLSKQNSPKVTSVL